jgi:hypothetical protein
MDPICSYCADYDKKLEVIAYKYYWLTLHVNNKYISVEYDPDGIWFGEKYLSSSLM